MQQRLPCLLSVLSDTHDATNEHTTDIFAGVLLAWDNKHIRFTTTPMAEHIEQANHLIQQAAIAIMDHSADLADRLAAVREFCLTRHPDQVLSPVLPRVMELVAETDASVRKFVVNFATDAVKHNVQR